MIQKTKNTIKFCWSIRYQFIKYAVVGGSGFVLDFGTLILFKEKFGINPVIAVMINQMIVLSYNFTLNKYWSFKNREMPHKQLVRYLTLAAFNISFSVFAMYLFNALIGLDYRLVRLGSVMVMVLWNFALYKYWVYKEECA